MPTLSERIRDRVLNVPDFPKPGILFKDITPILADAQLMRDISTHWCDHFSERNITHIAAIESRGFLFGVPLAMRMNLPLVVIRKPGKLPRATRSVSFALEYGEDSIEMHEDAVQSGDRVLILDDLLATGGTAEAAGNLIAQCGAEIAGYAFVVELAFLQGRERIADHGVDALDIYA